MAATEFRDIEGVRFANGLATQVANLPGTPLPYSAGLLEHYLGLPSNSAGKIVCALRNDGGIPTGVIIVSNGSNWFYKLISTSV